MAMLDSGVRLGAREQIVITAGTLMGVARAVIGEGEPNLSFIDHGEAARKRLKEFDGEDRRDLKDLLGQAGDALALAFAASRQEELGRIIDVINQIAETPGWQLNRSEAKSFLAEATSWTRETERVMSRLRPLVAEGDLRSGIAELKAEAGRVRKHIADMNI